MLEHKHHFEFIGEYPIYEETVAVSRCKCGAIEKVYEDLTVAIEEPPSKKSSGKMSSP